MTDTSPENLTPQPKRGWTSHLPDLKSPWWKIIFGASLMFNLLIAGLAMGHRFGDGRQMGWRGERMPGASLVQIAPNSFFSDLPRERRRELLGIVRGKMRDLRKGNPNDAALATKLAEVLENDTYVETEAKAAIEGFTIGADSRAGRSSAIALEFLAKLTPEERKSLAAAIRQRVERQSKTK
jgi:hypothetical protein